jgi:hypothetical protein
MSTTQIRHDKDEPTPRRGGPPAQARHSRGSGRIVAGVAAVMAVIAASLAGVAWLASTPDDGGPAGRDPAAPTSDERVAQRFLTAYTSLRPDQVALRLADGTTMPTQWWREMQRYEAWGTAFLVHPCETIGSSAAGTDLLCPFDFHALGTEELDRAPFGRNAFAMRVDGGEVVSFAATFNNAVNGFDRFYAAVGSWVRTNHPGDWSVMDTAAPERPAELAAWQQLWDERRTQFANRQQAYVDVTTGPAHSSE